VGSERERGGGEREARGREEESEGEARGRRWGGKPREEAG